MPTHVDAWVSAFSEHGKILEKEWIYRLAGVPAIETVVLLNTYHGWNLEPEQVVKSKHNIYDRTLNGGHTHPPIIAIVEVLLASIGKLPIAIGTGSSRKNALTTLGHLDLIDHVDAILTATDVEKYKPHPETFLKCAEQLGVVPENCLVFEDGMPGIIAAKSAGMHCLHVQDVIH